MTEDRAAGDAPSDPIAAVTCSDPYGYYGRLVAERPLYRDPTLGLWVASSAAAVSAVLASSACRVRPVAEPVPPALLGSPAAEIFRHLVRMNDGAAHCPFKEAVAAALDGLDDARLARTSERWAARLAREIGPATDPARLTELAFDLSPHVVGSLLGVADEALGEVARLVGELVRCLAPGGTPEQIETGKIAAGRLRRRFDSLDPADTLLAELAAQARRFGRDDPDAIVANALGLMTQAYDATAGLIGTTLLTLAREPDVRDAVAKAPALLGTVVAEVLRYDSPVQNTRRFVAESVTIEGHELRPGEAVLVVLAAANRDPKVNPAPDRFDLSRHHREVLTFGVGPHACPGRKIATTIATEAVARLLANGVDPRRLETRPAYRPSASSRIPLPALRGQP